MGLRGRAETCRDEEVIYGLNVGFGAPIGPELLAALRERGVQMVRLDCQGVSDIRPLIIEVQEAQLIPIIIIRPSRALWVPPDLGPLDVEISNEPNLGTPPAARQTSIEYAIDVQHVAEALGDTHRLWAGVISNLDRKALQWLRESIDHWPAQVGVSVHRYPPTGAGPAVAHAGHEQRENEVAELQGIIGNRPWGVSECGYHTAEWSTGWWLWRHAHRLTDQQVAEYTAWEADFWTQQNARFFCAYQINDGLSPHYNDHFGWRDINGNWKLVADTFRAT